VRSAWLVASRTDVSVYIVAYYCTWGVPFSSEILQVAPGRICAEKSQTSIANRSETVVLTIPKTAITWMGKWGDGDTAELVSAMDHHIGRSSSALARDPWTIDWQTRKKVGEIPFEVVSLRASEVHGISSGG
jgi:hypothetical protein